MRGRARSRAILLSAAAALLTAIPVTVTAQPWVGRSRPRPGSVEVSVGAIWTGSQTLPASAAELTNPSGLSAFELFTSEPSIDPVFGVQGTAGVYLTRRLVLEAGLQFSRPQLKVRLSDDAEDAPDVTASATMTSYVITGSLLFQFGASARTIPFVAAGAGHLRDVHAGNELVETGTEYHARAGIKHWFNARRKLGIRAEGGLSVRDGGFSFDGDRRMAPTAAVSLLYLY